MARHYVSSRWPTTPADLGRLLADPQRFADLLPDAGPDGMDLFAHAYASASPQIQMLLAEREQLGAQQALIGGAGKPPAFATAGDRPGRRGRFYGERAPGTLGDDAVKGERYPLAAIARAADRRNETEAALALRGRLADATAAVSGAGAVRIGNAMSERVPSEGGFLVPEVVRDQILTVALETSIVRPRAMPITMDSLRVPLPTTDDTSHASSVFGGVVGYWTEEGSSLTASAPSFARMVLEAKKLTLYTTIPNELLQDAPNLQDYLYRIWPMAVGFYEDLAFLTGSGVGEPEGIINCPGAVSASRETASEIQFIDLVSMYSRLYPAALPGAVWITSPDVIPSLLQLAVQMTPGTATSSIAPPVWLMQMSAAEDVPETILGKPLLISEKVGPLGSTGDLIFANFGYYALGDRQVLHVALSDEYLFAQDMVAYRMIERLDGRGWVRTPISPANGGTKTLSPYVVLHS